jgi:hypothetical protein
MTLREKLADKYTLEELKDFQNRPLHELQEIKNLVQENSIEITEECFPLLDRK